MAEILLCSEAFIKKATSMSDNLSGKYILPALRDAQELGLKSILGETLLDKCKSLYSQGQLTGVYKTLVDKSQNYLAFRTIVGVTEMASYKIGNFGVTKTTDENQQVASAEEIAHQQYFYQSKADAYCHDLQNFIIAHCSDYPELSQNQIYKIQSNLYSAATCGIWLGGARGKRRASR